MMASTCNIALRAFVLMAVLVGASAPAWAVCTLSGPNATSITGGTSTTVTPSYDPGAGPDQIHNFTVTISNPNTAGNPTCRVGLSFTRPTLPATMTNGSTTLQYSIESTGGATLLQTTGFAFLSSPPSANRIDVTLAGGATVNVNVRIRIPAGQTSATSGSYTDGTVTVGIYELFLGCQSGSSTNRISRSTPRLREPARCRHRISRTSTSHRRSPPACRIPAMYCDRRSAALRARRPLASA